MPDESLTVTKGTPNPYTSGPKQDIPTGQPTAGAQPSGPPEPHNHLQNLAALSQTSGPAVSTTARVVDSFSKAPAAVSATVPPPAPVVVPTVTPVSASPVFNPTVAPPPPTSLPAGMVTNTSGLIVPESVVTVTTTSDLANGAAQTTTAAAEATQETAQAASWFSKTGLGRLLTKFPQVGGFFGKAGNLLRAAGPALSVLGAGLAIYDIGQDFNKEDKTDAFINLGCCLAGLALALALTTNPVGWGMLLVAATGFGLGNLVCHLGGRNIIKGIGSSIKNFFSWATA